MISHKHRTCPKIIKLFLLDFKIIKNIILKFPYFYFVVENNKMRKKLTLLLLIQYSFVKFTKPIPFGKFSINQMAFLGNLKVIAL